MKTKRYWRNSVDQWGLISRLLHWLMAIIIIRMLAVGLYMSGLTNSPLKLSLINLHKATGVVALGLLVFRLLWRLFQTVPSVLRLPQPHQFLAKMSVPILYIVLFIMLLSGIAMSQTSGYPVSIYGWFTLPQFFPKNPEIAKLAFLTHKTTGWILIGLICLHILAALYHEFCRKDYLLTRMWKVKR
ncbi:cytochrome b [Candidatus Paracaedibacter symbiosus]|uniref:cytochrome b n=1 Tax=Candidatus Paracaedibacter symbiosus TaxID=244582 RepID=UPI0005097B46|nr:cytochrome b [Candidatus Paracaedibacter symbiosus]